MPEKGYVCSYSRLADFFDAFSELTGAEVPQFPAFLLSPERISKLKTATRVGITTATRIDKLYLFDKALLRNLKHLSLEIREKLPLTQWEECL